MGHFEGTLSIICHIFSMETVRQQMESICNFWQSVKIGKKRDFFCSRNRRNISEEMKIYKIFHKISLVENVH